MSTLTPPIQALLDLFQRELAEVRFGDIDARRLAALATDVQAAAEALEAHEATTSLLRRTLTDSQELLMQQAQRALAFARIYAENDDELAAKLNQIALPRAGKRAKSEAGPKQPAATQQPVEVEPAVEAAPIPAEVAVVEEPAPASPSSAVSRRGKRRDATRVVARDDEAFDGASEA